jgi:uncharacterized SAM-binding protein YcdF (DUF218 family)
MHPGWGVELSEVLTMRARVDVAVGGPGDVVPRRRGRLARWMRGLYQFARGALALGMLAQILLVLTPAPLWLQSWLDVTAPARKADVILCLGGSDLRLIWTAELFHQGFAPVIVVSNHSGAGEIMRMKLVTVGVPADRVLVDENSYVTADHPAAIARLPGIDPARQRFLIVTTIEHSRRASACFRRGGYVDFSMYAGVPSNIEHSWRGHVLLLPQLAYEYAGLLQYWIQGRI